MNKDGLHVVEWTGVAVLLAIGFAVLWVMYPGFKDAAAAEWTSAIGTCLAFVGTIYLAGTETRRRKRTEQTLAQLAAAGLVNRVVTAHINVQRAIEGLRSWPGWMGDYIGIAKELESTEMWSNAELVPLVALHENCAHKLAVAKANVDSIVGMMMGAHHNARAQEDLPGFHKYTIDALLETERQLQTCADICMNACMHLVSVD